MKGCPSVRVLMRCFVRHFTFRVAAGLVGLALIFGASPANAATLTPNYSILIYKPGLAVTGTLKNGIFTQRHSFTANGWTAAAVSRDTLLLYNANTGKLKTGLFRGGTFTSKDVRTIRKGWTTVAASCDTVLFYNGSSGAAFTAPLKGGFMGTQTRYGFSSGWTFIDASCNTVTFLLVGSSTSAGVNGLLKGGRFTQSPGSFGVATYTNLAHTDTSYFLYSSVRGDAIWGPSGHGTEGLTGGSTGFSEWNIVAGSPDSLLFYMSNGIEDRATLKRGDYASVGGGADFSSGWTIIVGGR